MTYLVHIQNLLTGLSRTIRTSATDPAQAKRNALDCTEWDEAITEAIEDDHTL